jgi:hypothetical protein
VSGTRGKARPVLRLIAQRRKAIVGLVVTLVGGLLAIWPDSAQLQALGVLATAIAAALGVHQVTNAPLNTVHDVVDDVLHDVGDVVPEVLGGEQAGG